MKKFRFRFASVLREREIKEQECKKDFAVILKVYEDAKKLLNSFYEQLDHNMISLAKLKKEQNTDISLINDLLNYEAYLKNSIVKQLEKINILAKDLEEKRLLMVEAMKRRKIMEKLQEKDKEVYYKEINELEQKETDEYSVLRVKGYV